MLIDFSQSSIESLVPKTDFQRSVITFLEEWYSPFATVKVQTSGSTGMPKTLCVEKEKMKHSAKVTCDFLGLQEDDLALLCLPVEYISGKMMIVRAIMRKMKLCVVSPSLTPLENLQQKIDFCAMTPLQAEKSFSKIHDIKKLIIGGAQVSEGLKKKISSLSIRVYETYGMTETLSHIALKLLAPKTEDYFCVLDDITVSQDKRGCLEICAPHLHHEIIQTHDRVELRDEKSFRFLGREDNVINSGGIKIFPEELEAIAKKEITEEVVFLGLKDKFLGEKLVLVVEGQKTRDVCDKIGALSFSKKYHVPKEIFFLKKIPRTPNGKIDRKELRSVVEEK
ncbi:MAG: long-chain fatty acid--CoA ligase [Bergeyella sp.]|nr:long-chain fatty acid--CoA ligase [Bergeyella sp.]